MNVQDLLSPLSKPVTLDDLRREVDKLDLDQGVIVKNNKLASSKKYEIQLMKTRSIIASMVLIICNVDPKRFMVRGVDGHYELRRNFSFKDKLFMENNILWGDDVINTPYSIYSKIYRGRVFSLFCIYLIDNLESIVERKITLLGGKESINYEEKRELILHSILEKVYNICNNGLDGTGSTVRQAFIDMFYLMVLDTKKKKKLKRREEAIESIRYNLEILSLSVTDEIYRLPDDAIINNVLKLAYQIMTLDTSVQRTPALNSGISLTDVDTIYELIKELGAVIYNRMGDDDFNDFLFLLEESKPIRNLPSKAFVKDKYLNLGYKAMFFVLTMLWDEEAANKIFGTFMKW